MTRTAHFLLACLLPLALEACRDRSLELPEETASVGHDPAPVGHDLAIADSGRDLGAGDLPPPCMSYLTESDCRADARCEANTCPTCHGEVFLGCTLIGAGPSPAWTCPAMPCLDACSVHGDQLSCDQDPGCTTLYKDLGTCDCNTPGCCMGFDRCVDQPVQCSPNEEGRLCQIASWDCGSAYAPIFDGGCQIGCARLDVCVVGTDCRETGCAAGYHCDACWLSYVCMLDGQGNAC